MLKQPNGPFVLYAGSKKWVKHKGFEACIRSKLII
ncbi:excisionase [uncultured Gemmiger sp.]|nr:excisionase [uncultured Gemmiger sp.]